MCLDCFYLLFVPNMIRKYACIFPQCDPICPQDYIFNHNLSVFVPNMSVFVQNVTIFYTDTDTETNTENSADSGSYFEFSKVFLFLGL